MIVKDRLELVYGKSGNLSNIFESNYSSLKKYEINKLNLEHIKNIARVYGSSRSHFAKGIVDKNIPKCKVIEYDKYPLSGFSTKGYVPVVNLVSFAGGSISDFTPANAYSLYLYSIAFSSFAKKKPFRSDIEEHVSSFIFTVFMRMFGKQAGLVGSYKHLIPQLRFIISLYVSIGMMGNNDTSSERKKIALRSQLIDIETMKMDYDFSKIKEFLKCINENRIIPISENVFSSKIIRMGGIDILPIFEDISRFFAVFLASTVSGNTIFGGYLPKVRPELFQKLVYIGYKNLNRIS